MGHRLREVVGLPVLTPHRSALTGLARVLDEQEGIPVQTDPQALNASAESWAQLDLAQSYGRPETFAKLPEPWQARWAGRLELLPPVLVFVPLGVTWLGLSAATDAYQQLRSTPEGQKLADRETFLELWQNGFHGRLDGLAFGSMAWWTLGTLIVIALLVLLTGLVRRRTERRDEQATHHAAARLTPLLAEAQLRINVLRWESPARLAGELGRAAQTLGEMIRSAQDSQNSVRAALADTTAALRTVRELVAGLSAATPELTRTTQELRKAADALDTSQREAAAAAGTAGERLRGAMETVVSATQASMLHAEQQNARVAAAATERLEKVGEELTSLVRAAGAANEAALSALGDRSSTTLDEVREGLRSATGALEVSGRDLGTAGEELAEWVRRTTDQGVSEMTRAFRLAIAAAAVDLATAVEETGRVQQERTERIGQVVDRFDTLLLAEADRQRAALDGLAEGVAGLREAVAALERSAADPAGRPRPVAMSRESEAPADAETARSEAVAGPEAAGPEATEAEAADAETPYAQAADEEPADAAASDTVHVMGRPEGRP
ncbi:hypothetical protein ACF09Y_09455 [Streptomyces massasporeus]|uniref:hypothetical protein n=1 Tax=Streptomyces massasporeus TaxID=67324 RepID=UPI0036FCB2C1